MVRMVEAPQHPRSEFAEVLARGYYTKIYRPG
jgi:hypothetical protein